MTVLDIGRRQRAAARELMALPAHAGRLGRSIEVTAASMDRKQLVKLLELTLGYAGTDHETWGSLASRPRAA